MRRVIGVYMLVAIVSTVVLWGAMPVMAQQIEITYADWGGTETAEALVAEFMRTHPDIKVSLLFTSNVFDHHERVQVMAATGTLPDLVRVNSQNAPIWLRPELAMPLNDLIARDNINLNMYPPGIIDAMTIGGTVYSLPISDGISTDGFAVNIDIFNRAGVPVPGGSWTWDDLLAVARVLTIPSFEGPPQQYGLSHIQRGWYFNWVWSNGGELVTPDGKTALTQPEAYEAIQWWGDLVARHGVAGTGNRLVFDAGNAALGNMALGGAISELGIWQFDWTFLPYPHGKVGAVQRIVAHPLIISRQSGHVEAAWTFLKWLASKEGQEFKTFELKRGSPTHREVLVNPSFLLSETPPYDLTPFTQIQMRQLPAIQGWDEHDNVIRQAFLSIQSGAEPASAAMQRIAPILNDIIARGLQEIEG